MLDQATNAAGVQVFIGEESGYQPLDDCTVVTSTYSSEHKVLGVLGVIGPTRMEYERVIPIVDLTAKNILDKKIIAFSKLGEYNVSDQYSQTISNEKKLIQNLSDKIAEEIMLELSEKLNDI